MNDKKHSSERRLRLRKDYKESTDDKACLSVDSNNESGKNDVASTSQSTCDDSIMDFKSPRKKHSIQPKVINSNRFPDKSKKKALSSKIKVTNNEKKSGSSKSLQNRKILRDKQQPSIIESSFFKSEKQETDSPQSLTNVKTAYVCPLCFKNFKDENSQAVHAKSCAVKNNVTTKKLMDAMELQERQAAERKSLGLLSAPVLQDKKKPAPSKMASHDPDLQLALALSKSLYEKEMEEWDEAQIIAISSSSPLPDNNVENVYKTTLQNFGFTSNRNVEPASTWPTNKTKRRKPLEPTTLQSRTAVDRERILTERIAEILMAYKDFTQKSQEVEKNLNIKEKMVIRSQLLQQLHQAENTLWDRTRLTSTQNMFYVKQLSPQIAPLEKKKQKLKEEQNDVKLEDQNVNNEESLDNKQMQAVETADNNEKLIISSNSNKTCCKEKKFLDTLATSWQNILNDSSASDIIIFVRNSRHIWAHKLVFYVRCTNILLDVTSNDTEYSTAKEKICWIDVDYDVALIFLEFIYCGLINRHLEILNSDTLSGVRFLARKYKVNDLFAYLRQLEFNSTVAQVKYTTCEKSTENLHANVEKNLNISKLEKSTFNASPNHIRNDLENIWCSQKMLQKDVNDTSHSLEDSCISAKDSCILQDEKIDLMKLPEKINLRSDTPTNCTSPDMFDDTPVTKRNDKSAMHSEDYEDSNIHVLLSLIKQDADADICSQRSLTRKTQRAEYSESCKEISTCLKNVEQSVIEIDSDSEVNSLKSFIEDAHENPLIDTSQSSKSKFSQDCSLNKQKSDLTLFIEKVQRENAKSDLDSDIEYSVEMSSVMYKNPFRVDRPDDLKNSQSCDDNNEQISNKEKKHGKLSIIEQRMQSYAEKNPEFYSRLSNESVKTVKHITSHMDSLSSEKTMDSFHSNVSNYTQNYIPPADKDINVSKQVIITPLSSQIKTTNQSHSETVYETDEEDISMYSRYMRDHKDNSIAKYRTAIRRNKSDGNLTNKNVSFDSITKNSDINESKNNEVVTQSTLTQKDVDVIVDSSDTEIESVSSNVSCPIALQKDNSDHEDNIFNSVQQTESDTKSGKHDIENERNNKSPEFEIPEAITTDLEEEINVNDTAKSNRDEFNTSDAKITSDDIDFSAVLTQKSKLNESNDDQNTEFIPSPIMISSSPDFLNMEDSIPDIEHCDKNISETDSRKSRNAAEFSLNFEDDIYLANVNVDRYKKYHALEKSQSASQLNITEFKKNSSRRYNNKNNRENIKRTNTMSDDVTPENLDRITLTQNLASIRTFKKKSLSEGQININRLRNQQSTSEHISMQLQCKYNQNIGTTKTAPKIIEKDVTPPPDYHGMKTPELHKEMKKYGLKAQKRSRAVKLLTHIYNELHPLVSISEVTTEQKQVTEILSDEDEGPPSKKRNVDNNSLEKSNDSDDELLCSQDSNDSVNSAKDATSKEMQFYETESLPALENSSDITEAFTKLIMADKILHNKILRYEPINIEMLHATLRAHGFKCKLSNLMSFLDEQCITFYAPEQNAKSRTRKKV